MGRRHVVAFINARSGGQGGLQAMRHLQGLLRPDDTLEEIKPSEGGPRPGLLRLLARLTNDETEETTAVILSCGGDGTFNWISSTLLDICSSSVMNQESGTGRKRHIKDDKKMDRRKRLLNRIEVIPMPLGTGNDLSRCLGWGSSGTPNSRLGLSRFLETARGDATEVEKRQLDMWSISFSVGGVPKFPQFQNYFSVGVDAEAAFRFG